MSAIEWIIEELRISFLVTAMGIIRLLFAYVFLRLGYDEYKRRRLA